MEEERLCSSSTFVRPSRTLVRSTTAGTTETIQSSSSSSSASSSSSSSAAATIATKEQPATGSGSLLRLMEHVDSVELWTGAPTSRDFVSFSLGSNHFEQGTSRVVPSERLVTDLMHNFGKGRVLNSRQILSIVRQTIVHLEAHARTVMDVRLGTDDPERKLVIVGDLHGQLPDLLTILRLNGLPGAKTVYVFNGDFVDRGDNGLEVVLLLFAALLTWPGSVHLNRGNHEDVRMNIRYNFSSEVGTKCLGRAPKVFEAIHEAFKLLPLVTVVDGDLMIVHGGLYDVPSWSLDDVRTRLQRRREVPLVAQSAEDLVFQGLLWSDPRPIQRSEESRRGAGIHFGTELSAEWMRANGIRTLVRSHELCEKGYDLHHGLTVITVFSASRYCNKNDNFGAFLILKGAQQPEVHRYRADSCPGLNATFSFNALVQDVLRTIGERVYDSRDRLRAEFLACADGRERITRVEWAEAMKRGTAMPDIPFLLLQQNLVALDRDGLINWRRYLNRFQVRIPKLIDRLSSDAMWSLCQQLYDHYDDLRSAFDEFDRNGDGEVDRDEFTGAIRRFGIDIADEQLAEIFALLDTDGNQRINGDEFFSTFLPLFSKISDEHRADVLELLKRVSRVMRQRKKSIKDAFLMFDADGDGRLSYEELFHALASVLGSGNAAFPPPSYHALARFMDTDKSGTISYDEFRNSFRSISSTALPETLNRKAIENLVTLFRRNSFTAVSAFALFDEDFSGTINKSEFFRGFELFNDVLDHPLTPKQLQTLWECFDRNAHDELEYRKFYEFFQVHDTQ